MGSSGTSSNEWVFESTKIIGGRTKFATVVYQAEGSKKDLILIIGGKFGDGIRTDQVMSFDPETHELE